MVVADVEVGLERRRVATMAPVRAEENDTIRGQLVGVLTVDGGVVSRLMVAL